MRYELFGSGLPWNGKLISREAAAGLLHSAAASADIYLHPMSRDARRRASRVWVLAPRKATVGGCFNIVVTYTREAAL